MTSQRETVEIVDKLIELTQHGNLVWSGSDAPYNLTSKDVRVGLVYKSHYLNKTLRVYHNQFKYYIDESSYVWDNEINFEIIDNNENVLWRFPATSNISNLLSAIQYQTSQVGNFYQEMFGKKQP